MNSIIDCDKPGSPIARPPQQARCLLDHSDVSTTMIYIQVLKAAAGGTASPLDALA